MAAINFSRITAIFPGFLFASLFLLASGYAQDVVTPGTLALDTLSSDTLSLDIAAVNLESEVLKPEIHLDTLLENFPAQQEVLIGEIADTTREALIPAPIPVDTLTKYDYYSRYFYENLSFKTSAQLLPLEKYLTFLIKSINTQIRPRKNLKSIDLKTLDSKEITQSALANTHTDKANYYAAKYDIWTQFQFNELFLKIDKAVSIKRQVWEQSSSAERLKMFRADLAQAMEIFEMRDYNQAILLFQHILEFYNYENVDDVLFFLSESHYGLQHLVSALEGYEKILQNYPQSEYFEPALFRCLTINSVKREFSQVHKFYSIFAEKSATWKFQPDIINFTQASALFEEGDFDRAQNLYAQIPPKSDYYGKAQYLRAHCFLRMKKINSALNILSGIINEEIPVNRLIWNETAVLIGDVKIVNQDHNQAWGYYRIVDNDSPYLPRALIGQALVRYLRYEFDLTEALCDSVIKKYKNNNYIYEARCLKSACQKYLGKPETASEQYATILDESEKKINLANYLTERLKVTYLVNEIRKDEESILSSGNENLFFQYWSLRNDAERLLQKAFYSEVLSVKPGFQEYLNEKLTVMDLVDKFVALSEEMQKTKDVNLEKRYTVLQSQIANVNLMVQASGYGRLKKLPYYYNNTETEFSNQVIDSLYQSTSTELGQIEEELVAIATSLVVAENNIKPEKRAQMLQTAYNISQWRNELDRRIGRDLLKIQSIPDLDLTRWSHVAFHKTMVPGADFNDLKAEQKRVKDIEKFLQSIDNISNQLGVKLQP